MSRWETSANSLESGQPVFRRHNFVEITTSGGNYARAWDGLGHFFDGVNTWTGLGVLGSVGPVQEESDLFPRGVRLTVSGLPSSANPILGELNNERLFNQVARLYTGFMKVNETALVSSLSMRFYGHIGNIEGKMGDKDGETSFELTVENPLREAPRNGTYSHADHYIQASGDTLFQFMDDIPTAPVANWGKSPVGPSPDTRDLGGRILDRIRNFGGG